MFGTEVDLQQIQNTVVDVEMVLKAWLQEQGGEREQLHLLLPSDCAPGTARTRAQLWNWHAVWNGVFVLPSSVRKVWHAGASDKPRPHPAEPQPGGEDGERSRLPACQSRVSPSEPTAAQTESNQVGAALLWNVSTSYFFWFSFLIMRNQEIIIRLLFVNPFCRIHIILTSKPQVSNSGPAEFGPQCIYIYNYYLMTNSAGPLRLGLG